MKKLIAIAAFIMASASIGAFANDDHGISREIAASFKKDFNSANHVSWQNQDGYSIARFKINDQFMTAYYGRNGVLVAVLHNIPVDHLPLLLLTELQNDYSTYWVTDLFEAATDGESHYHLTLENGEQTLKLKSVGSTDWTVSKKIKKDLD